MEAEQHKQRAANSRDAPPPEFSTSLLELQPYSPSFPLDAKSLQSYHLINTIPFPRLRSRFVAIQTVNAKLSSVLPLVDFSQAGSSWSLAHRLSAMSWLILREVKTRAWASILRQTGNAGTTTCISVNRPRALRAREKGDLSGMKSVFGQIYRQLHFIRPALLRTDQRPWRVTFEGEGGTDAGGLFRDSVSHLCFDPTVCVWLADGSTKRVDQLVPADELLDELGQRITIVPDTLIGTVGFPQPLPGQPGHAAGSLVPTPGAPGHTTLNPGYLAKRRIHGVHLGFEDFIVSANHPLTVASDAAAKPGGGASAIKRATAYHLPSDCVWQQGQAPPAMVGQPIPGYAQRNRHRGGLCRIRPHYWGGGVNPLTGQPYVMGGHANGSYRDPRAPAPLPVGGWPTWQAAQAAQFADWNHIHQLPQQLRVSEFPVNVIEGMPPAIKGGWQTNGQWYGVLKLMKLSTPVVFPVNNYLLTQLNRAMEDMALPTGVVDGVDYAHPLQPHPRVFFRAAQLVRALRLTAAAQPGVYAFHDAAAVVTRAVLDEQNYRDASQAARAAVLAAQVNPNVAAPVNHPVYQRIYANPNPYQAIFPPDPLVLHALPPGAGVQEMVDYMVEVTAWVVGLWLADGGSAGTHIGQSLHTEYGLPAPAGHGIPNDHSGVFERCRHWVDLLGLPANTFHLVPAGLGHGVNQLPHSLLTFNVQVPGPGHYVGQSNVLRNLLVRCGVVVVNGPLALNKPRFWDAALPNRLGWQNETARTRRAFLAGYIDGDGSHVVKGDAYRFVAADAYEPLAQWVCTLFRQLGFRTSRPAVAKGSVTVLSIQHQFADQRLLPIAIWHKRTVGVGLRDRNPNTSSFRIETDDGNGNPLAVGPVVSFRVQGGTGTGRLCLADGTITHNCSELQSSAIPLFIQSPNAKTHIGDNQDKWCAFTHTHADPPLVPSASSLVRTRLARHPSLTSVDCALCPSVLSHRIPNPAATSSLHLSMYSFVGKLMGIAIRGGHMLNLDLPSLVFRPLVGQPITRADLVAVDALSFDVLDKMSAMAEADAEQFTESFALTFTTVSSDGREVELQEGGKDTAVTWHNRLQYVQLVEAYRLQEFHLQTVAMKKGLGTIVPIQLLPLFTAGELEAMICGKREISIDYLRANTRYRSPISSHDRHVTMLWDVLQSFNHEERQLFIRFVWGQSRLPYNPSDFVQKFEVWPHPVNNDAVLPVSHTVSNSLPTAPPSLQPRPLPSHS